MIRVEALWLSVLPLDMLHVIKNGCRVEALQLGHIDKLELALAVYMVVAWRLARLLRFGQTHPDGGADALLSEDEWQGAYILAKKKPPPKPPPLREAIRQIAMLGGFLGRKCDGEPGVKTLWLGFQRLRDFVQGIEFMRTSQAERVVRKGMGLDSPQINPRSEH